MFSISPGQATRKITTEMVIQLYAKAWGAEKIANVSNWHVHVVCREKGQGIVGNREREREEGKGSGPKQVES
jgi:hypothetical protein